MDYLSKNQTITNSLTNLTTYSNTNYLATNNNNVNIKIKELIANKIKECEEIMKFISNLNKNLTVDTLVPAAEGIAYFKGKLTHTNECTIHLGDDYYIKTTNHKAIEILKRKQERLMTQMFNLEVDSKERGFLGKESIGNMNEEKLNKFNTVNKVNKVVDNIIDISKNVSSIDSVDKVKKLDEINGSKVNVDDLNNIKTTKPKSTNPSEEIKEDEVTILEDGTVEIKEVISDNEYEKITKPKYNQNNADTLPKDDIVITNINDNIQNKNNNNNLQIKTDGNSTTNASNTGNMNINNVTNTISSPKDIFKFMTKVFEENTENTENIVNNKNYEVKNPNENEIRINNKPVEISKEKIEIKETDKKSKKAKDKVLITNATNISVPNQTNKKNVNKNKDKDNNMKRSEFFNDEEEDDF